MVKIVLTGGGTGGHIYPALAIGAYMKKTQGAELLYIGSHEGLENEILPKTEIPFKRVRASGLSRKLNFRLVKALVKTAIGTLEALTYLYRFKPNVVIGTGGFVCASTILAAKLLRIPCLLHEQNAYPGLTNRLLSSSCKAVMISFPEVGQYLPKAKQLIETGLPIRDDIFTIDKKDALSRFNLAFDKKTLLITGGSRGAKAINDAVIEFLPDFLENQAVQVIFATGKANYNEVLKKLEEKISLKDNSRLVVKPYLDDMPYALKASDVILSRAGATFIAEITSLGLTGVLVPYPYASENHQKFNAQAIVTKGGAELLEDHLLSKESLTEKLMPFFEDDTYYQNKKVKLQAMVHQDVLEKISDVIITYQKEK